MKKVRKLTSCTAPKSNSRTEMARPNPYDSAEEQSDELIPLEQLDIGVVNAMRALQHWLKGLTSDAGFARLSVTDAIVLDQLEQRAQHRCLADICFMLNTDDIHIISYSLRKLTGLGIVNMTRRGKEVTYSVGPDAAERLSRLREDQERQLLDALSTLQIGTEVLGKLAQQLRRMSGLFDQAARAAASL